MKVTRQRKDTERRLIITLGRFERSTTKTEILGRIRHQKNNLAIGKECGAVVRHEFAKGAYHQLYFISADEFWRPNELVKRQIQSDIDAGFLIKTDAGVVPATVAHLPGFIDMINKHMAYVSGEVPDDLDDNGRSIGSRGKDGFYSPRINTAISF